MRKIQQKFDTIKQVNYTRFLARQYHITGIQGRKQSPVPNEE